MQIPELLLAVAAGLTAMSPHAVLHSMAESSTAVLGGALKSSPPATNDAPQPKRKKEEEQ